METPSAVSEASRATIVVSDSPETGTAGQRGYRAIVQASAITTRDRLGPASLNGIGIKTKTPSKRASTSKNATGVEAAMCTSARVPREIAHHAGRVVSCMPDHPGQQQQETR